MPADWMEQLRRVYPSRSGGQGWGAVPRLIHRILLDGGKWPQLLEAAASYRRYCDREGLTGTEYVRQARTFFGRDGWWAESYEPEEKPKLPAQIALERRWHELQQRANVSSFRQPTRIEMECDPSAYEQRLRAHEETISRNNVVSIARKA